VALAAIALLAATAGMLVAATESRVVAAKGIGLPAALLPSPGGRTPAQERRLLERIAQCESSGDPRSLYDAGRYRGIYQFDMETWRSVGGRGDPASASPRQQRRLARRLLRRRGLAPWPVCGPRALGGA
jgi:hypothetical protein